jgi:hypothetical protein
MNGPDLIRLDEHTLKSSQPSTQFQLNLYALTQQATTIERWRTSLKALITRVDSADIETARRAHEQWWGQFWNRSWINISGDDAANKVTQGYAMQRWMAAGGGRGANPMKYNGSIFTVGQEPTPGTKYDPTKGEKNADYRAWGSNYWFQNQRLVYWPMITSGDFDLLDPFIQMYVSNLPLTEDRIHLVYKHDGAMFPETMFFFGLPNNNDFGWDNKNMEMTNRWIRWHFNNGLELTALLLDRYDATQDETFARQALLPVAVEITKFFDEHWPHVDDKLRFEPAAALETRQWAINPAPDIAGLMCVLPRLLTLPELLTTAENRKLWQIILEQLPTLPRGKTDMHGKMPTTPKEAALDGINVLWPAQDFAKCNNVENPELYSVFPYRLFGISLPELEIARATYNARSNKSSTCWGQDGIDVACLGLAHEAKAEALANFTAYGSERFKWFWKPGHDWEPDLDNGGAGQLILQNMLLQPRGEKILLFPAWPKEWNVDFKLHVAKNTTIQCTYRDGKMQNLTVTPPERLKDVIQLQPQ